MTNGDTRAAQGLERYTQYAADLSHIVLVPKIYYNSCISSQKGFTFMRHTHQFTAIIEKEGDQYVALCPELDIASQGDTVEVSRRNLIEAIELFFESASEQEIHDRLHDEVFITRLEVAVG